MKNKKLIILLIVTIIIILSAYFITKKIQEENRKYEIETISEYKYFVVKENEKYGIIDNKGNKIIETKYEDVKIPNPEKDVFICYQEQNTIVLNKKNEEIFTEYNNIEPLKLKSIPGDLIYEKSVLKYSKNGKYGIIDLEGEIITKPIYEEIDTLQFKEGEFLVKKQGKYGVINIKGATLVKTKYDKIEADKFYEEGNLYGKSGYIVCTITDEGYRYGYVNVDGNEIIKSKYNDLYRVNEIQSDDIYIICAENGKYGLLKNNKQIIENEYQSLIYIESNNTIIALKGKKYGVISIDGNVIVPFEYKQIDITGEYIYSTISDENIRIFNSNGQETNMSKDLAIIKVANTEYELYIQTIEGKTTYSLYKNGQVKTKNEYKYIQYLYDNYFIACNEEEKLGIIDTDENIKLQFDYNSIQRIENTNMIQAINNDTKTTEIYSKEMNKITELADAQIENYEQHIKIYNDNEVKYVSNDEKETENTKVFINNKIFAKKQGNKWGFVDADGNKVVDYKYEAVTEVNKYGFAGIKQDGKWGIINSDGKIIVEPTYEVNSNEPIFLGEYYQVIYGNGEIYYTK